MCTQPHGNIYGYIDAYADIDAYTHIDAYAHIDAHAHTHIDAYCYTDAYPTRARRRVHQRDAVRLDLLRAWWGMLQRALQRPAAILYAAR